MGVLTAGCSPNEKEAPSTTTTTTTTSPTADVPSPTEKAVTPGGPNSFSPTVNPSPLPPTCTSVDGTNCTR